MKTKNWIPKNIKPGRLHKDLGIPLDKKIPMSTLDAVIHAHAGDTITNPSVTGKRRIHVTRKIEERAIMARTLKGITKKRFG